MQQAALQISTSGRGSSSLAAEHVHDSHAVAYGGQLWQILHWTQPAGCEGALSNSYGELSGPVTIESLYEARMLTNPCTGDTQEEKPYISHTVLREK